MKRQTIISIILLLTMTSIIFSCQEKYHDDLHDSYWFNKKSGHRSNISSCFNNNGCQQLADSAVQLINVNNYSPCQVYAVYDLWACYSLGGVLLNYTFTEFQVGLISNGCDSLKDRWDSIYAANDFTQLNYEMDLFYAAAKSSLEGYIMGQFFASGAHRDSFPCLGGNYGVLTSDFYTALCYKWCQIDLNGTPPVSMLTQIICGDACCKKQVEWCWDGSQNIVHFSDPSFTDYGDCGSSPAYICSGTTMGGNCDDHDCEQ